MADIADQSAPELVRTGSSALSGSRERPITTAEMREELTRSYEKVLGRFMMPVATFYLLIIPANFVLNPLSIAWRLTLANLGAAMLAIWVRSFLKNGNVTYRSLEWIGLSVLGMIFLNNVNFTLVEFRPEALFFFLLLLTLIPAVSVSLRVTVSMSAVYLVTSLAFAAMMGPLVLILVIFMSIAAAFASFGTNLMTRGAINGSIREKIAADRLRERAEHLADYDSLTGLPNRRHFFGRLEAFTSHPDGNGFIEVGILDLSGFKPVNDLYGHATGDELLVQVAARIRTVCEDDILVARLGGDEFSFAIPRQMEPEAVRHLGEIICAAVREPFDVGGNIISISAAIGFATWPTYGRTAQEIYERADHALYLAKRDKHGDVRLFESSQEAHLSDIGRFDQALRLADLDRELLVYFQPQQDLQTGLICGFEALARWQNPKLGFVNPGQFIAAAERSGIIERVTGVIVRKALASVATWPETIGVSINLSALDLMSERSIRNVLALVKESGVDPGRITFEITETALMGDVERAIRSLTQIEKVGCRIALDDFGSGYSNFAYIHRFPLHRLKTDRSFVTRLADGEETGRTILRGIADLCANLGIECLAEGVETEAELDTVRKAGISRIQGYYFGKPMPADAATALAVRQGEPVQLAG